MSEDGKHKRSWPSDKIGKEAKACLFHGPVPGFSRVNGFLCGTLTHRNVININRAVERYKYQYTHWFVHRGAGRMMSTLKLNEEF